MRGRYILASLLLAACSGQHTKPLEITEADNGKQLTLAVDGEFLLHLAANPSTGFAWQWQPALPAAISCKALAFASGNSDPIWSAPQANSSGCAGCRHRAVMPLAWTTAVVGRRCRLSTALPSI